MRARKTAVLAAASIGVLLLGGTAEAVPEITIGSPVAGSSISKSATPSLAVSGLVQFDQPQQADKTLYMRRTQCASGSDDSHLSTVRPGSNHMNGCLFYAQAANEVLITADGEGLSTTYPSENFAFTLDASKPITGNVRMTSGGFGQATTEIKLSALTAGGQQVELGSDSETYTVTGGSPNVQWSIQPPASEDKKDFTSISLNVRVRGINVLHGPVDHRNGVSYLTLPVWDPSPAQKVQFAIDSPNFTAAATRTATVAPDGLSWSGSTLTPAVGNHTLYARAVQGSATTLATPVPFTVTA